MTNSHFEPRAYNNRSISDIRAFQDLSLNTTTGKEYGDTGYQTNSSNIQLFSNMLEGLNASTQTYEDLTPLECTKVYNNDFLSNRRNLFLITNDSSNTTQGVTILDMVRIRSNATFPSSWVCPGKFYSDRTTTRRCNTNMPAENLMRGDAWQVGGVEIAGCKSEITGEKCKVRFSLGIMIVVIGCNLVKACCMVMAVVRSREPTLVTLGDAIDSFLETPDQTTIGICFADRQYIGRGWRRRWRARPRQWKQKGVQRWWTAVSETRWITCGLFYSITIIFAGKFLRMGIVNDRLYASTDLKSM